MGHCLRNHIPYVTNRGQIGGPSRPMKKWYLLVTAETVDNSGDMVASIVLLKYSSRGVPNRGLGLRAPETL